jgi:hypothetical protein
MTNTNTRILFSAVLITLFLFVPHGSKAQFYFGKNKVQYTDFDWQVMETGHFRIYYYSEEEELAQVAAYVAEASYPVMAAKFKHEVYRKIPLIIYSSPNYFTQTNVTWSLLPESVAGFTEYLKGRVVVPFHGSYYDFAHVIRHELVHVFQYSKLDLVMYFTHQQRMAVPPLWFIEGQAELWSTEWDSEADGIIKDMVLSGNLLSIDELYQVSGTYFMYKLGQSICEFINDYYGRDKIILIYENWWKGRTFENIIELTLGESLKEVSKKWKYHLMKKYFPEIAGADLVKREARQLTKKGFALKGVPIKLKCGNNQQDWIVFKANKMGYSGIYMMPPDGETKKLRTLLKGETSAGYESLHLLQSGIDANNNGDVLFSSKSEESDALYLYNIESEKIISRFQFPDMATISSPRFSPDNHRAVFSGTLKSGISDIYTITLDNGNLRQITDDFYYDVDPTYTAAGDSIIFVSDRCPDGQNGALNLYKISLSGGELIQLTSGDWQDRSPEASDSGIYFSSDRNGSHNIYCLKNDSTIIQATSLLTGVYDPRIVPGGTSIIFSGYQDFGFHVYSAVPADSQIAAESVQAGTVFWKPDKISQQSIKSSVKYRTDYSFDIAQSAISYDPVYGAMGGLQIALSDMLGDNIYYFLLANTAETKSEILSSFNVALTYLNKKHRLNWGIGAYHLYDEYFNDYDGFFFERQAGGLLHLNYPLSKFERLETTTYLRYSSRDYSLRFFKRRAALLSSYFSFVSDNSLWDISGPLDGHRYNITFGLTSALDEGRAYNKLVLADLRQYFRLGIFSALAHRIFLYSSTGIEPQRIYFGGSWSFRGYSRRAFYNKNVVFFSNELRFPLIDNLQIGFPFGTVGFRAIRGALFFDFGNFRDDEFHFMDRDFFRNLRGSFGTGFRVALGRVVLLRFDFSRRTDFKRISKQTDFDFFFGWNF